MAQMEVWELIKILEKYPRYKSVRFSMADDDSDDDGERWFAEDGVHDHFEQGGEVTICLVGKSNLSTV
jgi:hypothetical protein